MTRDELQQLVASKYIDKGIFYLAPRVGKVKTSFNVCEKNGWKNIKIIAPRVDIFEGWKADKIKFEFEGDLEFCTFTSLGKQEYKDYDLIIIDEIHESSSEQLSNLKKIIGNNKSLGLSGTMTNKTQQKIYNTLGMSTCFHYSIEKAVEQGILADYQISIHLVDLDDKSAYIKTSKGMVTEKKRYNQFVWLTNKLSIEGKSTFFIDLKIISLLQNSLAKKNKTLQILKKSKNERVLIFCGTTDTADSLGIPTYHSKSKDKELFHSFCNGEGNHLATIKMMQSGITILPISKGIINYLSGNPEDSAQKICRFLNIEYNNLDKKADIQIICSNTSFEKERLRTALMFFNQDKIEYLKPKEL